MRLTRALGDRVLAVTAVSATLPGSEAADAKAMAKVIGVEHRLVHSTEFEDPDFVQNPPDRCYICKKIRFTSLVALAKAEGYQWVVDGGNVDDLGDYRPGMKALQELSDAVRSPMIEAGLAKADIRALSKEFGLQTWNKQSAACLASRVPYGVELTPHRLAQIDAAEAAVAPYVQGSLRVRYHGDVAASKSPSMKSRRSWPIGRKSSGPSRIRALRTSPSIWAAMKWAA